MFGSAESEHPRLTNGEIISEEFQLRDHNPPTLQTDGRTDGQTDRRHAIARPRLALTSASRGKNEKAHYDKRALFKCSRIKQQSNKHVSVKMSLLKAWIVHWMKNISSNVCTKEE